MIQEQTRLVVADNTGAREIKCIRALGGSSRRYARIGDQIIAVVKRVLPNTGIKKGDIVRAVVVRTKKEMRRKDKVVVQRYKEQKHQENRTHIQNSL